MIKRMRRIHCVHFVGIGGSGMSGIAEAYMDQVPLVVLACGIRQDTGAAFQLHDIDQIAVLRPVTKGAFRIATADEISSMPEDCSTLAALMPEIVSLSAWTEATMASSDSPALRAAETAMPAQPQAA